MSNKLNSISPQGQRVYQALLNSNQARTAKQLGHKLEILSNAVYRSIEPLINLGLVQKLNDYPTRFKVTQTDRALEHFLLQQTNWFASSFLNGNSFVDKGSLELTFIHGRDSLLESGVGDMKRAKKLVRILVSGHEVPAEMILANKKAVKRGVEIRMLIQGYGEFNRQLVKTWKKIGVKVRKIDNVQARLLLYDHDTTCFMSYKNDDSTKDMGVRFIYPPINSILSVIYEQWWKQSKSID